MRNFFLSSTVTLIFLSLSGCGSIPTIDSVDPNSLADNQAMIVISVGAKYDCKTSRHNVKLRGPSTPLIDSRNGLQPAYSDGRGYFRDDHAQLHTMIVEPGEFNFVVGTVFGQYSFDPLPVTETFSLAPKETKYVGEVYRSNCDGGLKIRDMRTRDLPQLKEYSADIDLARITIDLLKFKQ